MPIDLYCSGVPGPTSLPATLRLREVGPRDGLQSESPLGPGVRADLIRSLAAAGMSNIEAVSFVSPKAVPSMAGAAEVLEALDLPDGVTLSALVPNARGAEMALGYGIDELTVTISVSETYNERNVNMSIEKSLGEVRSICTLAEAGPVPVDAVISCSFGSPYEGEIRPTAVSELADLLLEAGVSAITLADTTGMATPSVLDALLAVMGTDVGLHFHDTRGTALLNVYCAMQAGVERFDSAIGGLGGSPFAEGAAGNVATEEVVALADDLRIATGADLEKLLAVSRRLEEMIGHAVPSALARAGPRT
jgi:hydroxymethylglutaryl-CoA lyase